MAGLIRSTNLWGYDDLVTDLGADPATFRAQHDIPPGIEHRDGAFLEFAALSRLFENTAAALSCPDFGLRLVRWQGLGILGPVAVISRNSETVGAALSALARYLYAHSPALHLAADEPDEDGLVVFRYRIDETGDCRQAYELSLANASQIIGLLSGGLAPRRVAFRHQQIGPSTAYTAALRCEVDFGASWCGFVVGPEVLERHLDSADPEARRIATAYLESTYNHAHVDLAIRVAALVRRLLPTGKLAADTVADHLHLNVRTLQRQLAGEHTTYAAIVEHQRRELALHYLREPKLQLGQISALLGYSEQSTFNRSFRRWFGTTPSRYRARAG